MIRNSLPDINHKRSNNNYQSSILHRHGFLKPLHKKHSMARFSKAEREIKIEHARQLFCKGFDFQTIADIMSDVSAVTVERWAREHDFERSKRSQIIALSEIRNSILTSYADLLEGRQPKVKPDEAAKGL